MNKQTTRVMKTRKPVTKISTSISLAILTLGFSLLGFLSFVSSNREGMINVLSVENCFAMVGSSISIVLGAAFLVAASIYWRGYSRTID